MAPARLELLAAGPVHGGKAPLILLHGVSHGAWCWQQHFLPYFAERGHYVVAPSLRGDGGSPGRERLHDYGLDDYVDDLADVVATMPRAPVVVGHSMGGAVLQRYLQRQTGLLSGAVLLASMPPAGFDRRDLWLLTLLGWRSGMAYARLARGATISARHANAMPFFCGRLDEDTAAWAAPRLQPESQRAIDELRRFRIAAPPGALPPLLTIGSAADRLFGRRAVERTAAFYRSECIVFQEACHDLMLDPQWRACAEAIERWLCRVADPAPTVGWVSAAGA